MRGNPHVRFWRRAGEGDFPRLASWVHESLRLRAIGGGRKWQERTPAMAAGLTDHVWTMEDLLRYRVPPAAVTPPPRRSRPPNIISLARRRRAKARAAEAVA